METPISKQKSAGSNAANRGTSVQNAPNQDNLIAINVHIVQTVRLSVEARRACLITDIRPFENAEREGWKTYPDWLAADIQLGHTFKPTYCCALQSIDLLRAKATANQLFPLMDSATSYELQSHLFYAPHLYQWLILYRLAITLPESSLCQMLTGQTCSPDKVDLYNEFRDTFVRSQEDDNPHAIVIEAEREAKQRIRSALKSLFGLSLNEDQIRIVTNSGNITFFFSGANDEQAPAICANLTRIHEHAERVGDVASPLPVDEAQLFIFWGRFHTIITNEARAERRYMPMQFQAQLLWSFLSATDLSVQEVEGDILQNSLSSKPNNNAYTNALLNSIQYSNFMNEEFKRRREGDAELIYRTIEERWHLESSLLHLKDFAQYLSDYIERDYQKRSLASESRQNKVLSAIAILGVLALVETWSSYLSLVGESYDAALASPVLGIFGSVGALALFNTWFPIIIFAICAIAIVFVCFYKPRS